jgi:hypothetical protein
MGAVECADAEMDDAGYDTVAVVAGDRDRGRQCLPRAVGKASVCHRAMGLIELVPGVAGMRRNIRFVPAQWADAALKSSYNNLFFVC